MATLEQGIYTILTDDSGVSAITTRVYPWRRQQDSDLPAIAYELDGTEPEQGLDGYLDFTRAILTVSCIETTYGLAKELASKVRDALNGYTGTPTNGVAINSLVHDNDMGIVEDSDIGNSRGVSIIESEYVVWYSE